MAVNLQRVEELLSQDVTLHRVSDSELINEVLPTLATLNKQLRNQVVTLLTRFAHNDRITPVRKQCVMLALIDDDYLFYNMGKASTEDVYKRSYSIAVLSELLAAHTEAPFLTDDAYDEIYRAVLLYIQLEEDVRSYGKEGGLLQPVAHAAKALRYLLRDARCNDEVAPKIFRMLANKIACSTVLYLGEEQEVLSEVVLELLKIHLDEKVIEDFFVRVPKFMVAQTEKLTGEQHMYLYKNVKSFLYVLHLYIYRKNTHHTLLKSIDHCMKKITA